MSAFVCSAKTIAVLADRIVKRFNEEAGGYELNAADLAENMLLLNLKSVGYRYDLTSARACKEFTGKSMKGYTAEVRELTDQTDLIDEYVGKAELWGAAECFTYQSCEHYGAENDVVYKFVESFGELMKRECKLLGLGRSWGEIA